MHGRDFSGFLPACRCEWQQQGGKGHVNESRQIETTHLIVNEAAERKEDLQPDSTWRIPASSVGGYLETRRRQLEPADSEGLGAGVGQCPGAFAMMPADAARRWIMRRASAWFIGCSVKHGGGVSRADLERPALAIVGDAGGAD